jgi:hypothetical protein
LSPTQQSTARTLRFKTLTATDVDSAELIVSAGDATENRGQLPLWASIAAANPSRVLWVKQHDRESIEINGANHIGEIVALDDEAALDSILSSPKVLMDISGLQHHVWAPILKCLHARRTATRILYAEPESYREHTSPASASMFDLSVTFHGLAPLPGFARLSGPADESKCLFVAMLGFEGSRPESLVFQIDPMPKVIPVVGVPGFQIEYPAFTVACNRSFLDECRAHSEIRFARASCPFESFSTLSDIHQDYPDYYMYLAPVGTKPHALGVILYALANPDNTEVMFDHPVRKPGRTAGVGTIHIYDLGQHDGF